VTEKVFNNLPTEEKKYWHSHKHEVESGLLQLQVKSGVPGVAADTAEQPAMLELQQTYGKTIHTWAFDIHPDLPLGPPQLMMSYPSEEHAPPPDLVRRRDRKYGVSTVAKKHLRSGYLPQYEKAAGSDDWVNDGKSLDFEPVEREIKM